MDEDYIIIDSNGYSCRECGEEWDYPDEEDHKRDCSHHYRKVSTDNDAKDKEETRNDGE